MTAPSSDAGRRRYGGVEAGERREQRRAALIEAGLELFGTDGFAAVPVKRVCDAAGLTQRYFYESFADRTDLLAAVYDHCVSATRNATTEAAAPYLVDELGRPKVVSREDVGALAKAAVGAYIGALTDDSRFARIVLLEMVGISPALERVRLGALRDWADLILAFAVVLPEAAPTSPAGQQQRLACHGLVGAITQLLVDWYSAKTDRAWPDSDRELFEVEAIREVSIEMLIAVYDRILRHE